MPHRTSLYRHFDSSGNLLYVGISLSAVHRLKQHMADKGWAGDIASVTIEHYDTRDAALEAEREAIIAERPQWNVMHNRKPEPVNLWQQAFERLSAQGCLYDSLEEAEAAWEARQKVSTANFLKENPTFTVIAG